MALKTSLKLTPLSRDSGPGAVTASEVWTVPHLNVPSPQISSTSRAQWQHLNGLDISLARPDQVEVLLGANVLEAILQRSVRDGADLLRSRIGVIANILPPAGRRDVNDVTNLLYEALTE
ncbi:hypothetical protein FJT64_009498 [Amphibalanus amphitrite]|uniref:Uncharacterized protein n=1 Tax=Amphibalanus amphitrite TaxID=1232801 RepID=A0A6A4VQX4_AMPAM|nr:hypothetical protein FJT64_009498 [Amphibalanus amphitrite]